MHLFVRFNVKNGAKRARYSGTCSISWTCKTLKNGATIGFAEGSGEIYTGIKNPTNPAAVCREFTGPLGPCIDSKRVNPIEWSVPAPVSRLRCTTALWITRKCYQYSSCLRTFHEGCRAKKLYKCAGHRITPLPAAS
jgi:hypothetical protein